MQQHIAQMALVVRDYDEAIAWFRDKLNFRLIEDTPLTPEKRWVLVAPPGQNECRLLLARAANERQREAIGNREIIVLGVEGQRIRIRIITGPAFTGHFHGLITDLPEDSGQFASGRSGG